jgi:FtsP/CotA-like multicopper oxidase with cupredoxin domain
MLASITVWLLHAAVVCAAASHYKFELTWGTGAPDGHDRKMIFINGEYPGPLLEAQQGDWVEVEVCNFLPFNTTIHFHGISCPSLAIERMAKYPSGIHQTNTPWADGVPGLTQRPIQSGATYKYRWLADSYGSFFYHAHTRGQIDDGAYGPMIIRPKAGIPKPFSMISEADVKLLEEAEAAVRPLLLTDWRHRTSDQTQQDQIASGVDSAICMDSLLINGKGVVDCWSREEIDANVDPDIAPTLHQNGLKLTNKG